jgi:hypothetical protein
MALRLNASLALSEVVADWSRQNEREAIMELFPLAEAGNAPPRQEPTLLTAFSVGGGWTLRAENGVLLVQDQLAFLDRARRLPVAALAHLIAHARARGATTQEVPPTTGTPQYRRPVRIPPLKLTADEIIVYGNMQEREELWAPTATVPGAFSARYWNVSLVQLDAATCGMALYRRLTAAQRDEMHKKGRFALARCDDALLRDLTNRLLSYSVLNAQLWYASEQPELRKCFLDANTLRINPEGSNLVLFGERKLPAAP